MFFVVEVVDDIWCCRACDARAVGVAAVELCICDVVAAFCDVIRVWQMSLTQVVLFCRAAFA